MGAGQGAPGRIWYIINENYLAEFFCKRHLKIRWTSSVSTYGGRGDQVVHVNGVQGDLLLPILNLKLTMMSSWSPFVWEKVFVYDLHSLYKPPGSCSTVPHTIDLSWLYSTMIYDGCDATVMWCDVMPLWWLFLLSVLLFYHIEHYFHFHKL